MEVSKSEFTVDSPESHGGCKTILSYGVLLCFGNFSGLLLLNFRGVRHQSLKRLFLVKAIVYTSITNMGILSQYNFAIILLNTVDSVDGRNRKQPPFGCIKPSKS